MRQLIHLIKRNVLVYTRNRSNVFFSLFTMLIIIILMTVFLGKNTTDSIVEALSQVDPSRDVSIDRINANLYVLHWMVAGIVLVNSVTVSLSVVGIMIEDIENNKLNSMFVAPVKRGKLVLSYVLAGFLVSFLMCVLTVGIAELILVLQGSKLLSAMIMMKIIGVLVIMVFTGASFSFLCVLVANSSSTFATISSLVSTLIGFLAAIYIPIGGLPKGIANVLKYLPTLAGSSLLRELFTTEVGKSLFEGTPSEVSLEVNRIFGTSLYYGETVASFAIRLFILGISGIIFLTLAILIMRKKHIMDR